MSYFIKHYVEYQALHEINYHENKITLPDKPETQMLRQNKNV